MGAIDYLVLLLTHPNEFRTLVQYNLYHDTKHDITDPSEHATSGWNRETMRKSWEFLDLTSRSFSFVIKELDPDLTRPICLFYLVLRGLDTIEDDMTLPDSVKQPLLRNFHKHCVTSGWTFDGSGPEEKDRQLLVEFNNVSEELLLLDAKYRDVIVDICQKMASGMADFCHKAASSQNSISLSSISEYDLYCHYVAGLVGEGLSRIFSASQKEAAWLASQLELSNSMGLLLQKTNIIRDFREDVEERRFFWPKEIWGREWDDSTLTPAERAEKYSSEKKGSSRFAFQDMKEMTATDPVTRLRASHVQSGMILDAMRHLPDALDYLQSLRNQSVFNFCAIPVSMAIATLELCFMNPNMFQRNIKIRKAEAANLIMRSTNPREVALLFRAYTRKLHSRVSPLDPYFIRISVACGRIEQWVEHQYPSFVQLSGSGPTMGRSYDPADARTRIVNVEDSFDRALASKKHIEDLRSKGLLRADGTAPPPAPDNAIRDITLIITAGFILILLLCAFVAWLVLYLSGEPMPWAVETYVEP